MALNLPPVPLHLFGTDIKNKLLNGVKLSESEQLEVNRIVSENPHLVGAGKRGQPLYQTPSLDALTELESKRARQKQASTVRAYNQGLGGAYQAAKESANSNSFGLTEGVGRFIPANNKEFIERVRNITYNTFQDVNKQERDNLRAKGARVGQGDQVTAEDLGFIDTPVSLTNRSAAVLGSFVGDVAQNLDRGTQKSGEILLGSGSLANRAIDFATRKIDTTDSTFTPFTETPLGLDVGNILAASPWIRKRTQKRTDTNKDKTTELQETDTLWGKVAKIHNKRLRVLITEYSRIMSEWYHDPRTLCCFIKNVAAVARATTVSEKDKANLAEIRKWFDKQIATLKLIKSFLQQGISFDALLQFDIGLIVSKASVAALIAALMAIYEGLKDSTYSLLIDALERNTNETFRQCLPFDRLIRLIVDYIFGDGGVFSSIKKYVDDFIAMISKSAQFGYNTRFQRQMLDLTALDKLIALMEKIRDSLLAQELCIEADFTDNQNERLRALHSNDNDNNINISDILNKSTSNTGLGQDDDGRASLSGDGKGSGFGRDTGAGTGSNRVVFPTDNEVFNFITDRLGESDDFARQVISSAKRVSDDTGSRASGASDSSGASDRGGGGDIRELQSAIGDCAKQLNPDKVMELAKLMSEWNLGL